MLFVDERLASVLVGHVDARLTLIAFRCLVGRRVSRETADSCCEEWWVRSEWKSKESARHVRRTQCRRRRNENRRARIFLNSGRCLRSGRGDAMRGRSGRLHQCDRGESRGSGRRNGWSATRLVRAERLGGEACSGRRPGEGARRKTGGPEIWIR